ncbi:MAG: M20/M25/M40 family metallo-hydrolase [Rhizobiales bacterium]|nr:M20/M25/M40 family metallo-hydrolase [Hyphomicrobiales bacterium]
MSTTEDQNVACKISTIDEEGALQFLSKMVQVKSYSNTEGEAKLAQIMVAEMSAIGMDAYLQPVEGTRNNAIGLLRGSGGGKSLLFNGHIDTNPVTEGWTVDPWGGLVDDNFIYGIGVSNMKAGDAAYFWALKTLLDQGVKLKGDVILTFVVGELQGGVGTVRAIEQGIQADYFINAEPTDLNGMTLHAGAFVFLIELTGITRHMSKREEAVDVIEAASVLLPRMKQMTFSGADNADHASINRCHVGVIHAALGKELHDWRPPQVADYAQLTGTGRYSPSQSEESVKRDIRKLLDNLVDEFPGLQASICDAEVDTERSYSMLPFEVRKDSTIVQAVSAAYKQVRGEDQALGPVKPYCFYGTDASHLLHRAGMEGIVCGPGGKYNTMPDERVERQEFIDMIKIYMLAICDICEVDTD